MRIQKATAKCDEDTYARVRRSIAPLSGKAPRRRQFKGFKTKSKRETQDGEALQMNNAKHYMYQLFCENAIARFATPVSLRRPAASGTPSAIFMHRTGNRAVPTSINPAQTIRAIFRYATICDPSPEIKIQSFASSYLSRT